MSDRDCIVAGPPRAASDLRFTVSRFLTPLPETPGYQARTLGPRTVNVERLEIFNALGEPLLRQTKARAYKLQQPLLYLPEGGLENFHFAWATGLIGPKRHQEFKIGTLIAANTSINLDTEAADFDARLGQRLFEVVNNSAIPASDPAFKLAPAFFESLKKRQAMAQEAELALKLIADKRVTDFRNVYLLPPAMLNDSERLRAAIVARLAQSDPVTDRPVRALGTILKALPAGIFSQLRSDEASLLRDVDRRTLASGLIERQADRGAPAALFLAGLIEGNCPGSFLPP